MDSTDNHVDTTAPTAHAAARPKRAAPMKRTVLGSVQLGDDEIVVREFADGMFSVEHAGASTLASEDDMKQIVGLFHGIGQTKGWL